MTIGIIGSGKMVRRSLDSSHVRAEEVAIANSRGPETLADLVADIGAKTRALTMEEAVAFGDVVVLATPWRRREELPDSERFTGKLVVDAMNPYGAGGVIDVEPSTSSEGAAKLLPKARFVKAFNTIYYQRLAENGRPGAPLEERQVIFLVGPAETSETGARPALARCGELGTGLQVGDRRRATGGDEGSQRRPLQIAVQEGDRDSLDHAELRLL